MNQKIERFVTLGEAAAAVGMPYWKLQRAARHGLLNTYRPFNSRHLVRLSEVIAVIEASRSREGGRDD